MNTQQKTTTNTFQTRRTSHHISALILPLAAICAAAIFGNGCASPVPVQLSEKNPNAVRLPSKNTKVAVVVKDLRPENIQKFHICGTERYDNKPRPAAIVYLSNPEPLDALVAGDVKRALTRAGFDVVETEPPAVDTPGKPLRRRPAGSESDYKDALAANANLDAPTIDRFGLESRSIRPHRLSFAPPPSDVVPIIEVSIRSFNSDNIFLNTVHGWCSFEVVGFYQSKGHKMKFWGRKIDTRSYGQRQFPDAVNTAYWSLMHELEDAFKADDFNDGVKNVMRTRGEPPQAVATRR